MVHETRKVVVVAAVMTALSAGAMAVRVLSSAPPAGPTPGAAPTVATGWSDLADLTRLPADARRVLAVLLVLPAGALVTTAVRNVVGIATFGTFAPTLLALSFAFSDVWTAAAVFAVVLAAGLVGRALLGRLRLLMVPRLSVLLTVVVLALTATVAVLHRLGRQADLLAIILPLVVTTMLVERFFVCREEDGPRLAWKLMLGTLGVAASCLGLLKSEWLGRLMLRFPELLLVLAGAMLLVGRYGGYRLSELIRFRDLGRSEGPGET